MSASPTIRFADASDIPALVSLAAQTFPLACPATTPADAIDEHIATRLNGDVMHTWLSSTSHVLLVASQDADGLDGYALGVCGPCADPQAEVALRAAGVATDPIRELSKIYVRESSHGTALAGKLLHATLDAMREAYGPGPVWLGTNDANLRAQAFYRRHGFVHVGTRTFTVGGNRESDVVMVRREPANDEY